jgi:hypothetical protein
MKEQVRRERSFLRGYYQNLNRYYPQILFLKAVCLSIAIALKVDFLPIEVSG